MRKSVSVTTRSSERKEQVPWRCAAGVRGLGAAACLPCLMKQAVPVVPGSAPRAHAQRRAALRGEGRPVFGVRREARLLLLAPWGFEWRRSRLSGGKGVRGEWS